MQPTPSLATLLDAATAATPHVRTIPGFYVRSRPHGFAAHICASPQNLCEVRQLTSTELLAQGVKVDTVDSAQLVLSELVGNSVRAYGDHVPLVVEVYVTSYGVAVNVHDPDPSALPRRRATPLDSPEAETGRGLALVDLLAPGWHVRRSAIGKQVRCRVPAESGWE
ncbi:ATP-binding protein [Streptomyces sp. NBC_00286]|uniref:ATP-binding protein n=1 Tax=Streptomyces sp. NBC_00286 TaxID=2975701 RepID=UPI002E2DA59F|nr:ATP-binding protein [Streptomyces sp. NBC_00286]